MSRLEYVTECPHGEDREHWPSLDTPGWNVYCKEASRIPLDPDRRINVVVGHSYRTPTVQDVLDALEEE